MSSSVILPPHPVAEDGVSPPKAVSFEFFPPKSDEQEAKLWQSIQRLGTLDPDFISVTYGAGGGTRERTHRIVSRVAADTNLKPAAHLTTVGHSKHEIEEIARAYWESGVRHIVALRGDPPRAEDGGFQAYVPHPDGHAYAADLTAALKAIAPFEVSVGAYPETHPEATSPEADLDNLQRKIDAGADRVITQYFFESDMFLRFRDRCAARGIGVPIVPGILPVTNFNTVVRFSAACGASIPDWMHQMFGGLDDDPGTRKLVAMSTATEICRNLQAEGVEAFHFYTLNRVELTLAICRALGIHSADGDFTAGDPKEGGRKEGGKAAA